MKFTHRYKKNFILALAVVMSLSCLSSARAEEDAGVRSVFAFGAGNRALSLGGAYTALANDASATLWNPAGLGLVSRGELQASYANYFGFDMSEQYASLVLPSWRLGTASVTIRHFGVKGVEHRDSHNVLLANDLSDSEIELLIGYGRSFGSALSIGGALKLQRHSLAGYSGSGIGLDLGFIVHPLTLLTPGTRNERRLSFGLAVRNAIEPKIRLVREGVPDPIGIRLGLAYMVPIFRGRTLLATFDLENTREMDTRLHAGCELQIHPLLSIRSGINDGMFTAGTGVRWKSISINYAFENNQIDNIHRVEAGFAFGSTVEQSRQAALEAKENELEARLKEVFEQRQSERITELLMQAGGAQHQGRFDDALEILAIVTALEPGHKEARSRQVACLLEWGKKLEINREFANAAVTYSQALSIAPDNSEAAAGYNRCRAESDRLGRRSEDIRRQFAAALDAFSALDLVDARNGFSAILEVAPEDEDAAIMLQRTMEAIDIRTADLLKQADDLIEWGHFDEAESRIEEVRSIDPEIPDLHITTTNLEDAKRKRTEQQHRSQQEKKEPAESGSAVEKDEWLSEETAGLSTIQEKRILTEKQKREIEHLYEDGIAAMSENRDQDAIRYFELARSIDPDYQRVTDHLKREYLILGMEYFTEGKHHKAIEQWEKALRVDPTDKRVIGYLTRAKEKESRTRQILGK